MKVTIKSVARELGETLGLCLARKEKFIKFRDYFIAMEKLEIDTVDDYDEFLDLLTKSVDEWTQRYIQSCVANDLFLAWIERNPDENEIDSFMVDWWKL